MAASEPKALIEISSEAGRKIGGIYTVIRSKSAHLHKKFGENYLLIGMLDEKCNEDIKFEEPKGRLKEIFAELEKEGVHCKCGKWLYGDNSSIISVDAREAGERMVDFVNGKGTQRDSGANYFKYLLWKHFGIDSLMEKSWDFTENVVWGAGVGMLLQKLFESKLFDAGTTAVQFHEWITGAALLYCKIKEKETGCKLGTVFTTHATVLGRTMSTAGVDVYAEAAKAKEPISLNMAYQNRVEGKHQLEAAAARECAVFTTVSETVAQEVGYILGRKADVITVNGIEYGGKKTERDSYGLSNYARTELQQFLEACFISYYPQRYDNALFVYTSGRYEFTNKGFDLFISALGKLNRKLMKRKKNERRVFAFVFAPSSVRGPKISVIKNYLLIDKINEIMEQIPELRGKPYVNLATSISQLHGEIRQDIENMARGFYKDGDKPHINVYDLSYGNDPVISACIAAGLDNKKENPVKVIFYPTYMKPNDGLMNLNYYDVVSAMDVGIFPSRYEPFGYTPVEAAVAIDIAMTSDMTGFGRFIRKKAAVKGSGVKVLHMAGKTHEQTSDELARELERLYLLPADKLETEKWRAYRLMRYLDWSHLVKNYYKAYKMALERAAKAK